MRSEHAGQGHHQVRYAGLRRAVRHLIGRAYPGRDGGHRDDGPAAALGDHVFGGLMCQRPASAQVGVVDVVPDLVGEFIPGDQRVDSRVADSEVQPARAGGDHIHHRAHGSRVPHVSGMCGGRAARGGDGVKRLVRILAGLVCDGDGGTFTGQPDRNRPADASGRAGNNRCLTREPLHPRLLPAGPARDRQGHDPTPARTRDSARAALAASTARVSWLTLAYFPSRIIASRAQVQPE